MDLPRFTKNSTEERHRASSGLPTVHGKQKKFQSLHYIECLSHHFVKKNPISSQCGKSILEPDQAQNFRVWARLSQFIFWGRAQPSMKTMRRYPPNEMWMHISAKRAGKVPVLKDVRVKQFLI